MAVEKMYMMSLIGKLEDLDSVLTDIICAERISLTNALNQIEQEGLTMEISNEDLDKKVDFNYVTTVNKDDNVDAWLRKAERVKEVFQIDLEDDPKNYCGILDASEIDAIYAELESDIERIRSKRQRIQDLEKIEENYRLIQGLDVRIEELREMEYFDFRFGRLSSENKAKLRKHDDKLLASVFQVQVGDGNDVFLTIYPKKVAQETDRILRSLNWKEINLDPSFTGTVEEVLDEIAKEKETLTKAIDQENREMKEGKASEHERYRMLISAVMNREKTEQLKSLVASGSRYFNLTGWVPQSDAEIVTKMFTGYDDMLLNLSDPEETPSLMPPTRLQNNKFFEPFEMLVNMYGTPNYFEIDPTPYFGITYMLLFGMMFGDVGQGIIFALIGWLLRNKTEHFGQLLIRIGLASTVFGFLYGSVFSLENILPALLIRPFQEINTVLIAAIAFGVVLSSSAYIFNILNSFRRNDLEKALFGEHGLAGLLLLWSAILLALGIIADIKIIPQPILIILMILMIAALIAKQPLTRMIQGKKPLHTEPVSSYYIENSFGLIETLIAMLSGTISFVRVGAFAINHAGLFLAFETIGHMIGTSGGMISMTILGNIIIIGLEGLIVFIQGLRLEFYELFSKYYQGDGIPFEPISYKK